ncbi:hypothetical protein HKX48_001402 [Thoreauomyces humboldtii]|nr:hypothetical protein HKX48_001402 [Thoreauomyces humboldtii]
MAHVTPPKLPTILVLGTGFVGSYLGVHLSSRPDLCVTHLVARKAFSDDIRLHGSLCARSQSSPLIRIPASDLHLHDSVAEFTRAVGSCDFVFVTVKRQAALRAYAELTAAGLIKKGVTVVPLMNGVRAGDEATDALPGCTVVEAMWPFNVIQDEDHVFVQASAGKVHLSDSSEGIRLAEIVSATGIDTITAHDISAVLYGKLLINLHNANSALMGLKLQEELASPIARAAWAGCLTEALRQLPNFLFMPIAHRFFSVDPRATSSMYEDLKRNRTTEIDYLQGEIVRLSNASGTSAPLCERILALVRQAEAKKEGLPNLTDEILDALELL